MPPPDVASDIDGMCFEPANRSLFGSVPRVTRELDLVRVAECVHAALSPGGVWLAFVSRPWSETRHLLSVGCALTRLRCSFPFFFFLFQVVLVNTFLLLQVRRTLRL